MRLQGSSVRLCESPISQDYLRHSSESLLWKCALVLFEVSLLSDRTRHLRPQNRHLRPPNRHLKKKDKFQKDQNQRKSKGQQLKGKIVSALFHTFWHFSTHYHQSFSEFFLQDFFLELRVLTTVFVQRDEKRIKDNKKKRPNHVAR